MHVNCVFVQITSAHVTNSTSMLMLYAQTKPQHCNMHSTITIHERDKIGREDADTSMQSASHPAFLGLVDHLDAIVHREAQLVVVRRRVGETHQRDRR